MCAGYSSVDLGCKQGVVEGKAEREKVDENREGAQHAGTGMDLGGTKGKREQGSSRKLAARSNEAVVKVMANATAKRSCRAVCG